MMSFHAEAIERALRHEREALLGPRVEPGGEWIVVPEVHDGHRPRASVTGGDNRGVARAGRSGHDDFFPQPRPSERIGALPAPALRPQKWTKRPGFRRSRPDFV